MEELNQGVDLLERAISYTLGNLTGITDDLLSRPTPCGQWDLSALLGHLSDSVEALQQGISTRHVDVSAARPGAQDLSADPVGTLRERTCSLLGAWTEANGGDHLVGVDGLPLPASVMARVGAIEIAVHGWDIAQACGRSKPLPPTLSTDILDFATIAIGPEGRSPQFARPVSVSRLASPSDRLVAFLGRDPANTQ